MLSSATTAHAIQHLKLIHSIDSNGHPLPRNYYQPPKKKRDGSVKEVSLKEDTLTPEGWEVLTDILAILKPFYILTL